MRENLNVIWDCLCDQIEDCMVCPFQKFDCLLHAPDLSIEEVIERLGDMAEYIRQNG